MVRRMPLTGDEDIEGGRTGEEGEGGTDGEGDAEEDAEEDGARARTSERKRGNAPVWFHTRVLSPPSKSSSSEDDASSMSVSPGLSDRRVVLDPDATEAVGLACCTVAEDTERLYDGKMRGAGSAGVGRGVGEEPDSGGVRGRGGSRCTAP